MGAPTDVDLYAVVGTDVAADLLDDNKLADVASSGDDDALRRAVIGKVAGCEVVESNMIDSGDIIVFVRDAFTMAVVAPRVPEGVSFGQSIIGVAHIELGDLGHKVAQTVARQTGRYVDLRS